MMVVISSEGSCWTMYAIAEDRVFLVENTRPSKVTGFEAAERAVREAQWLFGEKRLIYLTADGRWCELAHDGAGKMTGMKPYRGPLPDSGDGVSI